SNINTLILCVYHILERRFISLTQSNEVLHSPIDNQHNCNYLLIGKEANGDSYSEDHWNPEAKMSVFLINSLDGTRRCLCRDKNRYVSNTYQVSPQGKYVIYFDE